MPHRYLRTGDPWSASLAGYPLTDAATQHLVREWAACRQNRFVNPPERECEVAQQLYRYRVFPVAPSVSAPYQIGMVLWDITEIKHLQDQLIQSEKAAKSGNHGIRHGPHEINNPAQAILSMAELIQENRPEDGQGSLPPISSAMPATCPTSFGILPDTPVRRGWRAKPTSM